MTSPQPTQQAKPANVQKRDTTFKQEHGAVSHLVKRKPEQAAARAVLGAERLVAEDSPKQALNVLTLAKPVLTKVPVEDAVRYHRALAQVQTALGNQGAADRAIAAADALASS